jgi:hypothetical protein
VHLGIETLPGQTTLSSRHRCNACRTEFTVTPAQGGDIRCKLKGCRSYDAAADVDAQAAQGPVNIMRPNGPRQIKQTPLDPHRDAHLQRRGDDLVVVRPVRLAS